MMTGWLVVLGVVVAVLALQAWAALPVERGLRAALASRDLAPLRQALERVRPRSRPTAYNHAIRRLWDGYERELAVQLVQSLAAAHPDSLIAQYWLKQALTAEPALAQRLLPAEFLAAHYQPEVAAACGPAG